MANYYSEINQGYYYSYIAAQAIIIFVELGLSNVLTIFASHESAKLKFNSKKILYGDRQALGRIKSLGKQSFKWYSISSIVITIVFLALGYLNFNTNLAGSWIALSVVYGLSLIPTPIMAILDGCNQIKNTNKYRLIATIFSSLIGMAAIVIGMNLWVPAIMFGTNIIIVALCLFINYKYFIVQMENCIKLPQRIFCIFNNGSNNISISRGRNCGKIRNESFDYFWNNRHSLIYNNTKGLTIWRVDSRSSVL